MLVPEMSTNDMYYNSTLMYVQEGVVTMSKSVKTLIVVIIMQLVVMLLLALAILLHK